MRCHKRFKILSQTRYLNQVSWPSLRWSLIHSQACFLNPSLPPLLKYYPEETLKQSCLIPSCLSLLNKKSLSVHLTPRSSSKGFSSNSKFKKILLPVYCLQVTHSPILTSQVSIQVFFSKQSQSNLNKRISSVNSQTALPLNQIRPICLTDY